MVFITFMCSSHSGPADGAWLRVASEGAVKNLYFSVDWIGTNATVFTVGTPVKHRMLA